MLYFAILYYAILDYTTVYYAILCYAICPPPVTCPSEEFKIQFSDLLFSELDLLAQWDLLF